jgi:hypothetical protein
VSTVDVIVVVVTVLVVAGLVALSLRGRDQIRAVERVRARELREVGAMHFERAEREHDVALEQAAEAEERRIVAARRLAHASAELAEADRIDPDA